MNLEFVSHIIIDINWFSALNIDGAVICNFEIFFVLSHKRTVIGIEFVD